MIIGGKKARSAVEGSGFALLKDALRLRQVEIQQLGDDFLMSGYV
jgi:riboflavin biosynthesis pyrimidine reductase